MIHIISQQYTLQHLFLTTMLWPVLAGISWLFLGGTCEGELVNSGLDLCFPNDFFGNTINNYNYIMTNTQNIHIYSILWLKSISYNMRKIHDTLNFKHNTRQKHKF